MATYAYVSQGRRREEIKVSRNALYRIIGGLVFLVVVLAIYVYDKQSKPDGIELKIGKDGVSIQEN